MRVITDTGELPSLEAIILQGRGELNPYNQTLRFKPGKDYTHPDFNSPTYNPLTQTYDFTWANQGPYVALLSPRDGSVGTPVWSNIGLEYIDSSLAVAGDVITFNGTSVVWSPGGGGGGGGVTSVSLNMPSAFTVIGSPVTSAGTFIVSGAGTSSQYIDGTGALQTFPGGGGTYTVNNGLTENPANNFQLGGTTLGTGNLIRDTYITNDGYVLRIDQINAGTNALDLRHSGTGLNTGVGLRSQAGGIAVRASSSESWAFEGVSALDYTAALIRNSSSTNDIVGLIKLVRNTSGTPFGGIGGSIDFWIEASLTGIPAPPSPTDPTVRLAGLWENPGPAVLSRLSRFDIYGYSNGGALLNASIRGDGAFSLYQYGINTFAGTPTYALGVDAVGNVVEFTPSTGGGGGLLSGTATQVSSGVYTTTITGVTSYTAGDTYIIKFTTVNDGASTLDINSLGAINIFKNTNTPISSGDIKANQEIEVVYDGTNFQAIGLVSSQLLAYVHNAEGATISKGQVVYAYQASGNKMSVKLAKADSDATSAKTIGLVYDSSIGVGGEGYIIIQGVIEGINTAAFSAGNTLYLSGTTFGGLTNVKPYAPIHLVYVGIVERANAGNGQIYVRCQNGYELDEIHDVDLITNAPVNNDLLTYVTGSPNLWKNRSLGAILGGTTSQYVRGDGTLATTPTGTVTGVTATSPITSSGGTAPVISTSMNTNRLIGRSTAGTGVMEEIQIGSFLSISNGVLSGDVQSETSQLYLNNWNVAPTAYANVTISSGSINSANWAFMPRYLPKSTTINKIAFRILSCSANITVRIGMYTSIYDSALGLYKPDTLLMDSGQISVLTTDTFPAIYSYTSPTPVIASQWVFLCIRGSGATASMAMYPNLVNNMYITLYPMIFNAGSGTSGSRGVYASGGGAQAVSSPLPATWSLSLSYGSVSNIPVLFFNPI